MSSVETVPLTSLSHGAGCGCKLGAGQLFDVLRELPVSGDPRLLVGAASGDDAAVFQVGPELALVLTVDFFTPIVDDPFDFGRIAAANALSDVYAMGGVPLTALNLVAFPLEQLGAPVLRSILEGGLSIAAEAGCTIAGGHSIDDPEPKYGLAVTGMVKPSEMITNAGAVAGDVLVLTKPLGVGALSTAYKRGEAGADELQSAVDVMTELNARTSAQARAAGAHAMTDVTGFGLLGHLHNVARESGVACEVRAAAVPALPGALEYLSDGTGVSGGGERNATYARGFTTIGEDVGEGLVRLACDPATSGGLVIALARERAEEIDGLVIGEVVDGEAGTIRLV
jgi:selenide,water dikinase